MDLRDSMELLRERDLLEVFEGPSSVDYEIASYMIKVDGKKAILVERPMLRDGRIAPFRVFGGFATSRETLAVAMGMNSIRELKERMKKALNDVRGPLEAEPKWKKTKLTLNDLPILKHYSGEPGPYMTASIVIFKDEGMFFSSYHRMLPISKDKLVLRAVEGRKLSR
ncbi:MAG: UbiD family decarboxylase, partial [Candidatus Korarchaeum sp.]|nr:UbiD family decarboxylase [Candidatus Korarchaeum sp.]